MQSIFSLFPLQLKGTVASEQLLLLEIEVFMSLVSAEMSFCSIVAVNFPEGSSIDVNSLLSDKPSSFTFAFNSLLNSSFSEVAITEGEASTYLVSGVGIRVLVVSCASLLGHSLFNMLLCGEALATSFVDDLEVNATAFLLSLLLANVSRPTFRDPLFGPDALLEILLVDANPLRLITSLRVVFPCSVIEPMNSLLGPEPLCGTLLPADTNSRARPTWRVDSAKLPELAPPETSGRVGVARLRNLSAPV